jgi:hypothetical protein
MQFLLVSLTLVMLIGIDHNKPSVSAMTTNITYN